MNYVHINTYGVRATLITPLPDFAEFVSQNYSCFASEKTANPHVLVNYSAIAGEEVEKAKAAMLSAGGGIYLNDKALYWENEFGFKVLVRFEDRQHWSLQAFHDDLLQDRSQEEYYQNLQRSMRWILHFPIFTQLQLYQGKILLHGAAVVKDGKALIFLGLNKVGKSTLVMHLLKEGFSFMSDNFLFFGSEGVYGFPERIRLTSKSLTQLQIPGCDTQMIYGKHHINLEPEKICLTAKLKVCFIVTNGPALKVLPLDYRQAGFMIRGMHDFLQESPQYSYFSFLPFFGFQLKNELPQIQKSLKEIDCFHLQYPLNWKLSTIFEEVLSCI